MKKQEIRELEWKCLDIKKMGWIKSINNSNSGIGLTFESLLGKQEENFEYPDYNGIEIKTRHKYSRSPITLFHATPEGNSFCEMKRISQLYGYPDKIVKGKNAFFGSVTASEKRFIGIRNQYQLKVDYVSKKIILCIYSWDDTFIENQSFWSFDVLKEKLYRKLQTVVLIEAYKKKIGNDYYFNYRHYDFFMLKDFDIFLKLIEDGKIIITFSVGIYHSEKKKGKLYDHGTGFRIKKDDLHLLFDKIE